MLLSAETRLSGGWPLLLGTTALLLGCHQLLSILPSDCIMRFFFFIPEIAQALLNQSIVVSMVLKCAWTVRCH